MELPCQSYQLHSALSEIVSLVFNSDVFVMLVNKFLFDQQLESNIKYQIHVPECFSRSMGDYSKEKRSVSLV